MRQWRELDSVRGVHRIAPPYFERHAPPKTPQNLVDHACLKLRLRTSGGLYPWALEKRGLELNVLPLLPEQDASGGVCVAGRSAAIQGRHDCANGGVGSLARSDLSAKGPSFRENNSEVWRTPCPLEILPT